MTQQVTAFRVWASLTWLSHAAKWHRHHSVAPPPDQRKCSKRRSGPVVHSQIIDSALKVCQEFLDSREHRDIDICLETPPTLTKEEWAEFIDSYSLVVRWVQCVSVTGKLKLTKQSAPQYVTQFLHSVMQQRSSAVIISWPAAKLCCRGWWRSVHSWTLMACTTSGLSNLELSLGAEVRSQILSDYYYYHLYQTCHIIPTTVLADLVHPPSRCQMRQASGSDPQAGGRWSSPYQGKQVGGAEVPGTPLAGPRHQIWRAAMVSSHRLEPFNCVVL